MSRIAKRRDRDQGAGRRDSWKGTGCVYSSSLSVFEFFITFSSLYPILSLAKLTQVKVIKYGRSESI
jgi:hypothetical protein